MRQPLLLCMEAWGLAIDCLIQTCFTPPITLPRTWTQSMLESRSSSMSPQTATFSPRIIYSPWVTSALGSGSSWGRMMRSTVWPNTIFANWSQDKSVPARDRPSAVRTRTFSRSCELLWPTHLLSKRVCRYRLLMYTWSDILLPCGCRRSFAKATGIQGNCNATRKNCLQSGLLTSRSSEKSATTSGVPPVPRGPDLKTG